MIVLSTGTLLKVRVSVCDRIFSTQRTWRITVLMRALTAGVSERAVPWKYHRTMPPLVKILNRSNMAKEREFVDRKRGDFFFYGKTILDSI